MRSPLRTITHHWQLKLLALALAVLLWGVVSGEQMQTASFRVPLEVRVTDPAHQLVDGAAPNDVAVRFLGPARDLVDLQLRRPQVVLEVPEVESADQEFRLEPAMVQVPGELSTVRALSVEPRRLRLRFRRLGSRTVPVRVRMGPGFGTEWTVLDTPRVAPTRVEATGPAARLEGLGTVYTLPLRLSPRDSAFDRVVELDTADLRGVRLSTTRVNVSGVADQVVERTLLGVPVWLRPGLTVSPATVSIRLRGPRSAVRAIRTEDLRVLVATDSIPGGLPADGVSVPLRVESGRPGVTGTALPGVVRLYPRRLPFDTLPLLRRER